MQLQTEYKFERFLNIFFGIIAILFLLGVAILSIFDLPPASIINALQFAMIGDGYYPILTIGILFIPIIIPLLLLKMVFILIFNTFFVKDGDPKIPYFYKPRW
ncbi:MAG: hypothetical protein AAF490_13180 [Chloroflexota bacterium]